MAAGDSFPTGGLGDLFSRLQEAQADFEAQEAAVEATVVEGHAAGGAVVIRLTGSLEVESVHIEPSIVDPSDPTLLEDAVLAALQDALGRIVELRSSLQVPAQAGLVGGIDLGGFAGNLDLAGLLTGVDLQGLMGNLGLSPDLGVIGALGAQGKDEDERDADDQIDEEPEA